MRLVLYTGKGGVGKTTTAAATAACAAQRGHRTLVVSADAAHSLADVLERRLDQSTKAPRPLPIAPQLDALEVDARAEMGRHWGRIRDYLVALFRYQGIEELVAEELALLPGAEELTTLLAVADHARRGRYEFVVVDCAPTGSTLRLVTLPDTASAALRLLLRLQQVISRVVTPLARNLIAVPLPESQVFRDAERLLYRRLRSLRRLLGASATSVRLVVTPERMVIDEARRAHTDLALFEVGCDAVVMNRMLPEQAADEAFFRDWARVQAERQREVEAWFDPLPVLKAPLREDEVTGLARLAEHGKALFADHDPAGKLCDAPRVRFAKDAQGYHASIPLPGARADQLDVLKVEDEIVVGTGLRRRAFKLPRKLAHLPVAQAKLEAGALLVRFADGAG